MFSSDSVICDYSTPNLSRQTGRAVPSGYALSVGTAVFVHCCRSIVKWRRDVGDYMERKATDRTETTVTHGESRTSVTKLRWVNPDTQEIPPPLGSDLNRRQIWLSRLPFNLHELCARRVFHDDNSAPESFLKQRGGCVRSKTGNHSLLAVPRRSPRIPAANGLTF